MTSHLIVLFRDDDEGGTIYKETIESTLLSSATVRCCPVMTTNIVTNLSLDNEIDTNGLSVFYQRYYGVILTSARSATVFRQLWNKGCIKGSSSNTALSPSPTELRPSDSSSSTAGITNVTTITNNRNYPPPFPCFVVGSKTAAVLKDVLNLALYGEDSGNAASLLPIILDYGSQQTKKQLPGGLGEEKNQENSSSSKTVETNKEISKSFLFLRGDKALDTIPNGLRANHWNCEEIIVYQTCCISPNDFSPQWKNITSSSSVDKADRIENDSIRADDWKSINAVVFSPSGFDTVIKCSDMAKLLMNHSITDKEVNSSSSRTKNDEIYGTLVTQSNISSSSFPRISSTKILSIVFRIIAIGSTTAAAIQKKGYTVDGIASTPDVQGLIQVLQRLLANTEETQ